MTNKEIKLELAKAMLLSGRQIDLKMQEIYEWIVAEDKVDANEPKTDYDDKPIGEVLQHIVVNGWHGSGYATKLELIFASENIKTIGDLLRYGKTNFLKLRNVGKGSITRIDDALEELYGIKNWYKS